jgi:hypothetical protein
MTFHLHDRTRRRIGLAAFFALGVAPTVAIGAWCILWQGPWHLRAESQRLGRQLGMDVALAGLRHPRPGTVVYEGLCLADPETGQEVLRCQVLEATWTETADSQRPKIVLAAPQVEIDAAGLDRLWQLVGRRMQLQDGRPEMEVRVKTASLTIRQGETSRALVDVQGSIGALPGGVQAMAFFRLPGMPAAEPIGVRVVRNRQLRPPADGIELDTAGTPLPCQLLALVLPELAMLGPSSRFTGYLWGHQTPGGWEGEISGRCLGIDLDCLVSGHFPQRLTGSADVTNLRACFHGGRLEEAVATLAAGPGVIGRRLLQTAACQLRLSGAVPQMPAGDLLPYDQLALAIALDGQGLRLQGRCAQSEAGTILRRGRVRLLGEPESQPQPLAALIRALAPFGADQIPATRQADWLARRLPAPEIAAPEPK